VVVYPREVSVLPETDRKVIAPHVCSIRGLGVSARQREGRWPRKDEIGRLQLRVVLPLPSDFLSRQLQFRCDAINQVSNLLGFTNVER
jgi:hypothetical protein